MLVSWYPLYIFSGRPCGSESHRPRFLTIATTVLGRVNGVSFVVVSELNWKAMCMLNLEGSSERSFESRKHHLISSRSQGRAANAWPILKSTHARRPQTLTNSTQWHTYAAPSLQSSWSGILCLNFRTRSEQKAKNPKIFMNTGFSPEPKVWILVLSPSGGGTLAGPAQSNHSALSNHTLGFLMIISLSSFSSFSRRSPGLHSLC